MQTITAWYDQEQTASCVFSCYPIVTLKKKKKIMASAKENAVR